MNNIYIALENLRSLYNIGAIFRTCSFYGIKNALLIGYSGRNFNTKSQPILHEDISKSSLGTEKDLNIQFLDDSKELIKFAKDKKLKITAIEQHEKSINLTEWIPQENEIIVFGNEREGISSELLKCVDQIVEIEKYGIHNSLNVTTSCGIVLYELTNELIKN